MVGFSNTYLNKYGRYVCVWHWFWSGHVVGEQIMGFIIWPHLILWVFFLVAGSLMSYISFTAVMDSKRRHKLVSPIWFGLAGTGIGLTLLAIFVLSRLYEIISLTK